MNSQKSCQTLLKVCAWTLYIQTITRSLTLNCDLSDLGNYLTLSMTICQFQTNEIKWRNKQIAYWGRGKEIRLTFKPWCTLQSFVKYLNVFTTSRLSLQCGPGARPVACVWGSQPARTRPETRQDQGERLRNPVQSDDRRPSQRFPTRHRQDWGTIYRKMTRTTIFMIHVDFRDEKLQNILNHRAVCADALQFIYLHTHLFSRNGPAPHCLRQKFIHA